jgi:hypothetical protein
MRDQKIQKTKYLFKNRGMIVKSSVLNKNKFCSNDIVKLISIGFIERVKPLYVRLVVVMDTR